MNDWPASHYYAPQGDYPPESEYPNTRDLRHAGIHEAVT